MTEEVLEGVREQVIRHFEQTARQRQSGTAVVDHFDIVMVHYPALTAETFSSG